MLNVLILSPSLHRTILNIQLYEIIEIYQIKHLHENRGRVKLE
jgi:hypothetical protein